VLRLDESAQSFAERCPEQAWFLASAVATLSNEALELGRPGFIGNAFVTVAAP